LFYRNVTSLSKYDGYAVAGGIWLVQDLTLGSIPTIQFILDLERWIPALGFSCGLDGLTTGMIAGRLIYYHRKQQILSGNSFYLPVIAIFIESAALSLISKLLQLGITSPIIYINPIVVPLCVRAARTVLLELRYPRYSQTISSSLIVLRKALGADIGHELAKKAQNDLSAPRFRRGDCLSTAGSIPGGLASHLIQTIGGHVIDLGPFEVADTLVPGKELPVRSERVSTSNPAT